MKKAFLHSVGVILIGGLTACSNCSSYYQKQILPMNIKAVVVDKYNDSINHTVPMVIIRQLTCTSEFTLFYYDASHLWDSLQAGDGLDKEAGTMNFYRIRAGKRKLFEVSCIE